MKGLIKRLLREGLLDEVSDELYAKIRNDYHNDRIIVSKDDSLSFDVNTIGQQELRRKPKGLWYGIGDNWIKWIKSGMPNWDHKNVYRLNIDDSKMKVIRTYDELIAFDKEYGTNETYNGDRMIDWGKVANKYRGIEIAPFIFEGHMNIEWYYGWDVASGCIWDVSCIKNVKKLQNELVWKV